MRNLFDQFQQEENQLTHALASVLAWNPPLCRRFVRDFINIRVNPSERFEVVQQHIPGSEDPVDKSIRRSLPDACIHGSADWCLVIESKIAAPLELDQLRRHRRMVQRTFEDVRVVAITADPTRVKLPSGVVHIIWPMVFSWLKDNRSIVPDWTEHLRGYMRQLEARFCAEGYIMRGPITTFDGVPFGIDNPYTYREAKLVLDQMMQLLRQRKAIKALGLNAKDQGRPAITGRHGRGVWDLLSLRPQKAAGAFTSWPHLTLGIQDDRIGAMVTIPNQINRALRRRLVELGQDGFVNLASEIVTNMTKTLGRGGYQPLLVLVQRHFRARRQGIIDGQMTFDLRTAHGSRKDVVKYQPAWIRSAFDLFRKKEGANIQLQFGAWMPHESRLLSGKDAIDKVEAVWLSCRPLLDVFH
jgi:hypothetical protein